MHTQSVRNIRTRPKAPCLPPPSDLAPLQTTLASPREYQNTVFPSAGDGPGVDMVPHVCMRRNRLSKEFAVPESFGFTRRLCRLPCAYGPCPCITSKSVTQRVYQYAP